MCDKVHVVFHSDDVKFWCIPVTRIDGYGFQPCQLLEEATVFLEVNYTVQLYIVAVTDKDSMFMYQLLTCDNEIHLADVDEEV